MDAWHYEPATDLNQTLIERLRRFPREPDMLQYALRAGSALALRSWLRIYHRLSIHGHEHLPKEGSFIVIANHSSHLDALCLMSLLPLHRLHRAFAAAASDYFFSSAPRLAASVLVVNALPFHREVHVRQSIQLCRNLLENPGNILIIFPEGTRSNDGAMHDFRPGVGLLLAGTNVPVVPVYLDGAGAALPKGSWLPRPKKVRCIIGPPRRYPEHSHDKASVKAICHDLQSAVAALRNDR